MTALAHQDNTRGSLKCYQLLIIVQSLQEYISPTKFNSPVFTYLPGAKFCVLLYLLPSHCPVLPISFSSLGPCRLSPPPFHQQSPSASLHTTLAHPSDYKSGLKDDLFSCSSYVATFQSTIAEQCAQLAYDLSK